MFFSLKALWIRFLTKAVEPITLKCERFDLRVYSHSAHRRNFISAEIKADIKAQYTAISKPHTIATFLQKKYNMDPDSPQVGVQDVHNYIAEIRRSQLGNKAPIQALHVALINDSDWFVKVELDDLTREVKYLFC